MAKSFKEIGQGIRKAIDAGKARGINRGLSAGRTEMTKRLRADTGLSSAIIKKRIGLLPAQASRALGWLYVGFKQGVKVSEFSPKEKIVKVVPRIERKPNAKGKIPKAKARRYRGVTIKVGKGSRQLLHGVFHTQNKKGKELYLARKLAYKDGIYSRTKTARYPTIAPRLNPIKDSAIRHEKPVRDVVSKSVAKNVAHEIGYRLGRIK